MRDAPLPRSGAALDTLTETLVSISDAGAFIVLDGRVAARFDYRAAAADA
eukprot:gene15692-18927_t